MKITSTYAILDVMKGRKKLVKHLAKHGPVRVTIEAVITEPYGGDDGTSIEFNMDVLSLEIRSKPMTKTEELKPCPFCGGKAELVKFQRPNHFGSVCTNCDVWRDDRCNTEAEAITAWNTRKEPCNEHS